MAREENTIETPTDPLSTIKKTKNVLLNLKNRLKQKLGSPHFFPNLILGLELAKAWFKRGLRFVWGYFQPNRQSIGIYFAVILISTFVLGSNLLAKGPDSSFTIADVDVSPAPGEAAKFVTTMSHYVPSVAPDPTELATLLAVNASQDYLKKPILSDTVITSETDTDVIQQRSAEMSYTVNPGDTISDISYRFALKVASIRYINGLEGDEIKPGQTITIPARDVDESVLAAWEAEKERQRQEEEAKRRRQLASTIVTKKTVSASSSPAPSADGGLVRPVNYQYISRGVSWGHTGQDMIAPVGTPVYSAAAGVVVEVTGGWSSGYGISVVVDHGGGRKSRYAHLSQANVYPGQSIGSGEMIALSGNTGRSTGPHLHFEYLVGGRATQPDL